MSTVDLLLHNLRTIGTHHCDASVGQEAADEIEAQRATIERRDAVIKMLERDAHEANQRAANAIGTRKVLWNLLGECLPLLEYDAQETHCGESHDQIVNLIQRINDARAVVQAEELPGRA